MFVLPLTHAAYLLYFSRLCVHANSKNSHPLLTTWNKYTHSIQVREVQKEFRVGVGNANIVYYKKEKSNKNIITSGKQLKKGEGGLLEIYQSCSGIIKI